MIPQIRKKTAITMHPYALLSLKYLKNLLSSSM